MRIALLKRMRNDIGFRIKLFLCISFVFNFLYATFLFLLSRIYSSQWFLIMAIYYALLCIVRVFISCELNSEKPLRNQIKLIRICGYFLFLLNFVVSVGMLVLFYTIKDISYHEITVIALATYTFCSLTIAIITSVRHLKNNDYIYFCVKMMSLISASVSMVTLTNTMLGTWGKENIALRSIILPILSVVVAIFILVCAILMIKKAHYDLRILKNERKRE